MLTTAKVQRAAVKTNKAEIMTLVFRWPDSAEESGPKACLPFPHRMANYPDEGPFSINVLATSRV